VSAPAGLGPLLRPPVPRLLAITDRRALADRALPQSFDTWLDELAAAGVDAVQVREKDLHDRALFALVRQVRDRLPTSVTVLVNGRLDVALAAGADGVHLPAAGLPAEPLRRWAREHGADPLIGRSTHTLEEVAAAHRDGVDYVLFGPVFATPSKRHYGAPPGPDALREACRVGLPVLALGGLDADGLQVVADAGAAGAAGIRVFFGGASRDRFVRTGRTLFARGGSPATASGQGDRDRQSPVVDSRDGPNR